VRTTVAVWKSLHILKEFPKRFEWRRRDGAEPGSTVEPAGENR